ncbi:hypothetical protein [Frankia sp. QA3]|uniref:hypothetical protein n=1 Tax=Frankia sp. QA3 TaxID=710111 RepID=UPI000269BC0E|nr:hypothetical protein [Frankia sp. QA3]EIV92669.1 hypothetical protein FraQA3DRAFT_2269 [Frankia sp. QA3]
MVAKENVMHRNDDQGSDDELPDRFERFVGGPGESIAYGPDGKPWKPGDPIPPPKNEPTPDE